MDTTQIFWVILGVAVALFIWRYVLSAMIVVGAVFGIFKYYESLGLFKPHYTEQTVVQDSFQPTSLIGAANLASSTVWIVDNWFKVQPETPPQQNVVSEEGIRPARPGERDEYMKECLELTKNDDLCLENWINHKLTGDETIIIPVEREVKSVEPKTEVKKVSKTKPLKVSKNFKLLDVDNEEYKQRRAKVLENPNAVVIHEIYH